MAFGYLNWNNTIPDNQNKSCNKSVISNIDFLNLKVENDNIDLVYNVESRFKTRVTKEKLHNAKTIIDILPEKATKSIASYYYSRVSILEGNTETDQSDIGNSEVLTDGQIKVLQSADYSTNIYIRSDYKVENEAIGSFENDYLTYFITIIPEKEAEYTSGYDALIKYLRVQSKDKTQVITKDQLKPGKVNFTVTKDGTVAKVKLTSTSGYTSVDIALVELINNMPEKWNPAMNSKGEKVDQEFVFFFGLEGC